MSAVRLAIATSALVACGDDRRPAPGDDPVDAAALDAAALDASPACFDWTDRRLGGPLDDEASVGFAPDGGVLVHGYQGATLGQVNLEPGGDPTGFVVRLPDRNGPGWRWELASPRADAVDTIEVGADGGILLAGRSRLAAVPPATTEQFQLVLAALDPQGQLRWQQTVGAPPSERPRRIVSAGDVRLVAGYHDAYVPTNFVEAWEDPFFVSWSGDPPAADTPVRAFRTAATDLVDDAAIDPDRGELLLAGHALGGDPRGAFIARFGLDGTGRGAVFLSEGAAEKITALRRLPDGDLLIAGSTFRVLGERSFGNEDGWVARYDPTLLTRRWIRQVGGAESDFPVDLAVDAQGRSWLYGETYGSVVPGVPPAGEADLFVIALDADGRERWRWQRGSAEDDRATRIAVGPCETVLVSGASRGDLGAGPPLGGVDGFVVRAAP